MRACLASLPRPVALVCGAGEQNCAAQAGMLDPLLAGGWRPDIVVGSSGGAIAAAAVIADAAAAAEQAGEMWRLIAASKYTNLGWTRIAAAVAGSERTRTIRAWRTILEPVLGETEFAADGSQALVATDLTHGTSLLLDRGSVLDALLMSAAFPVLLPSVDVDGATVIDGGFTAPLPVLEALAMGAQSIVALDTGRSDVRAAPTAPTRWYQVLLASIRHQVAATAAHDTATAAAQVPVMVLSAPEPFTVHWEHVPERIDAGRDAATSQLRALSRRWPDMAEPGVYAVAEDVRSDARLRQVLRSTARSESAGP